MSSCRARARAPSSSSSTSSSQGSAGASGGSVRRARSTWPKMPVRKLLKSWAMPPARMPTASSFCVFWICSSARVFSVTSRNTSTAPITRPRASCIGAADASIRIWRPSRLTKRARVISWLSAARPASTPVTGSSRSGPRLQRSTTGSTSASRLPDASADGQPVSPSATGFSITTRPSISTVATPSAMLRRVTDSFSFSSARAASVRWRAATSAASARFAVSSSVVRSRTRVSSSALSRRICASAPRRSAISARSSAVRSATRLISTCAARASVRGAAGRARPGSPAPRGRTAPGPAVSRSSVAGCAGPAPPGSVPQGPSPRRTATRNRKLPAGRPV